VNTLQLDPGTVAVSTTAGTRDVPGQLALAAPLPGLPPRSTYQLQPLDDIGVLFAIRSDPAEGPQIRLFVVSPHLFFPTYTPTLPGDAPGAPDDRVLLVVVHPSDSDDEPPTANLLAPLVVDPMSGEAMQVVLDEDYPLRAAVG
jgi:flagellar assembly factor FliW